MATAMQMTARAPARRARAAPPPSRVVVPVSYAAWLAGDLGRTIERRLRSALAGTRGLKVSRMPRGLLVEADEASGPLLEAVHRAVGDVEADLERAYPVFHHEMGPLWTGTLQSLFA